MKNDYHIEPAGTHFIVIDPWGERLVDDFPTWEDADRVIERCRREDQIYETAKQRNSETAKQRNSETADGELPSGSSWRCTKLTGRRPDGGLRMDSDCPGDLVHICNFSQWLESVAAHTLKQQSLRSLPMRLTTTTRQAGPVTILDISGRIVLGQETASLRSLVSDLLSQGHNKILFNFSHVDYIDSSGVGYLVGALTSVRNRKGELKLLNPTKNVQEVIHKTKLDAIFDIKDDEAAALSSFAAA